MTSSKNGKGSPEPSIRFIVTGFGPFHGVSDNPTQAIVQDLVEYLKTTPSFAHLADITRTLLLETSAQAVNRELDQLYNELESESSSVTTVLLHCGVNYCGTQFQLERCAYNNATFRVPDEQGYQPMKQCIIKGLDFESCLSSRLDIPELVQVTNATVSTETGVDRSRESTDPGRFVCNYAYCYSLEKFQSHQQCETKGAFRSLFLHVPPYNVALLPEQLLFVAQLMDAINLQLVGAGSSA